MVKKLLTLLMVMFVTTSVIFADDAEKIAFVKNSTGNTIALVEQNEDGFPDWSTIVIVPNGCVAIKYSEKK